MSAEYLAFLMMEGRQSDMLLYAQLLLDLREGLRVYHVPSKRQENDCKSCEVLARADEILKEADRG